MIYLCTFSDSSMSRSRALCIESALEHGIDSIAGPHYFDPAIEYRDGFTLEWLKSQPIYQQMGADWWKQRGIGYFLWKPYIIDLVMSKLPDGDLLVYSDAGVEFIDNIRYIIDRMDQDVWLFGNNWDNSAWCKRDVVEEIWPMTNREWRRRVDELNTDNRMGLFSEALAALPFERFGKQVQASVIAIRASSRARRFVNEWLRWCRFDGGKLIDDSPSQKGNHPYFREHRHDQAILTTLAYRERINLHYWPAMYNDGAFTYEKLPEYAGDDYPVLFHHHRRRDSEWTTIT